MRQRAAELGAALRRERGVEHTVRFVVTRLEGSRVAGTG